MIVYDGRPLRLTSLGVLPVLYSQINARLIHEVHDDLKRFQCGFLLLLHGFVTTGSGQLNWITWQAHYTYNTMQHNNSKTFQWGFLLLLYRLVTKRSGQLNWISRQTYYSYDKMQCKCLFFLFFVFFSNAGFLLQRVLLKYLQHGKLIGIWWNNTIVGTYTANNAKSWFYELKYLLKWVNYP